MKSWCALLVVLLGFGLGPAPAASPAGAPETPELDTPVTLTGRVTAITRGHFPPYARALLVKLTLDTGRDTVEVLLGPASYVDNQKLKLAVGDGVEIRARRLFRPRGAQYDALMVRKGSQVMHLRDDNGAPLWGRGLMWPGPGKGR